MIKKFKQIHIDTNGKPVTILFIGDLQITKKVMSARAYHEHLYALAILIVIEQPDIIVVIGDLFDMESLSSYDIGQLSSHGKKVIDDINSGKEAIRIIFAKLRELQAKQRRKGKKIYKPKTIYCLGNHEQRIERHINAHPEIEGFLSYDNLELKKDFDVVGDFLQIIEINKVHFSHFFYNRNTGKPLTGNIQNLLNKIEGSFAMGHQQRLEWGTKSTHLGETRMGYINGCSYLHQEGYRGYQANDEIRSVALMHGVKDGMYDLEVISLDRMIKKYKD